MIEDCQENVQNIEANSDIPLGRMDWIEGRSTEQETRKDREYRKKQT